jgi:uncharacterized repeat protein (TIGR01451 family)
VRTVRVDSEDHRFINRLANPALPTTCGVGVRVLLLLDTSGSTSGFNDQYNKAAQAFISTLGGTPTSLKISSFATNSSPGNTMYDLSTPAGQTGAAAAVDAIYPDNESGRGATNWDAALQDAAKADVDVIVFVTDGNPTVQQGDLDTGSSTSIRDITYGVASANLAKNPDMAAGGSQQTMMAAGVGGNLAIDNLQAVSGPNEGTDWTAAEDPTALAETLRKIAESICPADLAIVKKGDATVAPNGLIAYDLTVTNNGAVDIPFSSIQVTDVDATIVPPAPAPLGPGKSLVWKATRTANTEKCGTEFANTAKVELVNLPGYAEQDLTNNESTWKTLIVCPVDLSIAKSTGQASVIPGGTVTYDVTVTNPGNYPVPFSSIAVTDEEAALTPPVDPPEFLLPQQSLTWIATKAVASDATLCGTQVTNTASVGFSELPPGYVGPEAAPPSATASPVAVADGICTPPTPLTPAGTEVQAFRPAATPTLAVAKTGPARARAGARVAYRITVTNESGTDATGVVLRDQPPAAFALVAVPSGARRQGTNVLWDIGTIGAGQSVTKVIRFATRRTASGRKCNIALATATGVESVRSRACTVLVAARRPATPVTG